MNNYIIAKQTERGLAVIYGTNASSKSSAWALCRQVCGIEDAEFFKKLGYKAIKVQIEELR